MYVDGSFRFFDQTLQARLQDFHWAPPARFPIVAPLLVVFPAYSRPRILLLQFLVAPFDSAMGTVRLDVDRSSCGAKTLLRNAIHRRYSDTESDSKRFGLTVSGDERNQETLWREECARLPHPREVDRSC